jgi:hypothetical protein
MQTSVRGPGVATACGMTRLERRTVRSHSRIRSSGLLDMVFTVFLNVRFEVFTAVTTKNGVFRDEEWCLLGCYAVWLL